MKIVVASLSIFAVVPAAIAVSLKGTVTVKNVAPQGGTRQTPVWVGLHNGNFDIYDSGETAFDGLEVLAEDGDTTQLSTRFGTTPGGAWDDTTSGGPFLPGQEVSASFDISGVTGPLYFSYASMVLPSNDAFIANGSPTAHMVLSGSGSAYNLKFTVYGSEVLDAGTELNNEDPLTTAGIPNFVPGSGPTENGVVTAHPGFQIGGNILGIVPNGDFKRTPGYKMVEITVIITEVDGQPVMLPFFGSGGDPHFHRWDRTWYDFQGACDMTLITAKNFTDAMALTVYIRTKIRYNYSYIESAVVQLGTETLEVSSFGEYILNGISNVDTDHLEVAGFPVHYSNPSDKVHVFQIEISDKETVTLKTFEDMVSVNFAAVERERYHGSYGMIGGFDENGLMLGRDGKTIIEDPVAMAAEWQVKDDEPMVFQTAQAPQYPAKCVLPDSTVQEGRQRRLGESLAIEAAEKACAGWDESSRPACVHDVLATGDSDLAAAGAF
ncbi:expressed unknown protein [Seminavis robusta]|uniref:VWFD domain-containing protein n=1 Tax=Seminavis robusta TaxID=568900 RepID=A0A9N8ERF0_9STRA|nr:expressed unknown protein [Seminavis robusta]|eukprot:Sro1402_g269580.1 n/a (494) ;mRNA; f:18553-20300